VTPNDLDDYLRKLGYKVEVIIGDNGVEYSVIYDVTISHGSLKGKVCDVGLQRPTEIPYVLPAAIHTRPHLLPMDSSAPYATQPGHIGSEWQYWSRRFERAPTPQNVWAHIKTVLGEV